MNKTETTAARDAWFHERQAAWLYRCVAQSESDLQKRSLFEALAAAAETQAETWAHHLCGEIPVFRPGLRARWVATLTRRLGPRRMKGPLIALKLRGLSVYGSTPVGHAMPTRLEEVGLRHRQVGGGNLRAAVFGINDGLLSNASLILGVTGSGASAHTLLASGIAGLLAGALAMAAGEYVSMRSQRDLFEYQIGLERDELAEYPEEEAEELALIYTARGMDPAHARLITRELVKDPEKALDALAREELGLNPDDLGSPVGAAVASFIAFAIGAAWPLLPFALRLPEASAALVCAGVTLLALFVVGLAVSLFSGRNAWIGGIRMAAIGAFALAVTYGIGYLFGVATA
jgi:VIT1/CCC1 family predicted Fe2+/Mn2+ transporter